MSRKQFWRIGLVCFLRASIRSPVLLAASLGGIAAGTGILCALNLANDRALRSFEASARGLGWSMDRGRVSVQWRPPQGRVGLHQLDSCLAQAPSGLRCRGILSRSIRAAGPDGPVEVQILGVDGGLETAGSPAFSEALKEAFPNGLTLESGQVVRPMMSFPGHDYFVVLDYPDALKVLSREDSPSGYDWIEASYPSGEAGFDLALQKVEAGFTEPLRRMTAEQVYEGNQSLTATYRFNLNILGWMSILVGALLVANVSALYSLLKKPSVAVLRQLGAKKSEILQWVFLEQIILGAIGGVLGLVVGVALERVVSAQVIRTLSNLYLKSAATRPEVSPRIAILTVGAGILIYVGAGALSTLRLLRVQPASLGRRLLPDPVKPRRLGFAIVASLAAIWVSPRIPPFAIPGISGGAPQPLAGYLAALGIFVIAYAAAGGVLAGLARGVHRMTPSRVAERLPSLAIAARRAGRSGLRGRTQVATLAGGLSMVVGVTLMVGGFRQSLTDWLETSFSAEVMGEPLIFQSPRETRPRITDTDLAKLRSLPSVEGVDCLLIGEWRYEGRLVRVAGIEDALGMKGRRLPMVPLDLAPGADELKTLQLLRRDPSKVAISETFASKFGFRRGDRVMADLAGRGVSKPYEVVAVVREYSSEGGYILVDRHEYGKLARIDGCHNLRIYARKGADSVRITQELSAADAGAAARIRLFTGVEVRRNALRTFDDTFAVTGVLTLLAALLGGLSLLTQLIQSTAERKPEWAALRRLGLNGWGLLRVCSADILLSVFAGQVLGVACGALLGWILCFSINRQAFGWSVDYGSPSSWLRVVWISFVFSGTLWVLGSVLSYFVIRPGAPGERSQGKWRIQRE